MNNNLLNLWQNYIDFTTNQIYSTKKQYIYMHMQTYIVICEFKKLPKKKKNERIDKYSPGQVNSRQ